MKTVVINLEHAVERRFLEAVPRVRMNIDRSLAAYRHTGLATYCVRPPVVRHLLADNGNDSMIQATGGAGSSSARGWRSAPRSPACR